MKIVKYLNLIFLRQSRESRFVPYSYNKRFGLPSFLINFGIGLFENQVFSIYRIFYYT